MDIKIEAPRHENQEKLISFYTKRLENKFGQYSFIHSIDVKIKMIDHAVFFVALQLRPERQGRTLFVSGKGNTENIALNNAIRKMHIQIQKYKQKHYHNPHNVRKYSANGNSN